MSSLFTQEDFEQVQAIQKRIRILAYAKDHVDQEIKELGEEDISRKFSSEKSVLINVKVENLEEQVQCSKDLAVLLVKCIDSNNARYSKLCEAFVEERAAKRPRA